jgi:hypothetical protein
MTMNFGVDVKFQALFVLALHGNESSSASFSDHFTVGDRAPYTHLIGDRVGFRENMDVVKRSDSVNVLHLFTELTHLLN